MAAEQVEMETFHLQCKPGSSSTVYKKEQIVFVRDAFKEYGTKKNSFIVLNGLNMTVPKGVIYGLLGASGCGKTTLLNCILGSKQLNSGKVWVLGGRPGSKSSGVPGTRVGYMPQDPGQYGDFSIRETLKFYGWITNMTNDQVQQRTDFLIKLLMLPHADCIIKELSGGEQRRVSLASALLHEPELLVLDEPTVGADPLLREIIWNHFVDLSRNGQTIIITTHYIEEARQAHLIGLMRGGFLLAETSPQRIIQKMGMVTLEEAFVNLSIVQDQGCRRWSISQPTTNVNSKSSSIVNRSICKSYFNPNQTDEISKESAGNSSQSVGPSRTMNGDHFDDDDHDDCFLPELPPELEVSTKLSDRLLTWTRKNIEALVWKNLLWLIRNWYIALFVLLFPSLQMTFQCLCIGSNPTDLPIAVVNYETFNHGPCESLLSCNSTTLSCNFLSYLDKRPFTLIPYESEDSATQSVQKQRTYAAIVMRHNYSAAFKSRIGNWDDPRLWNVNHSTIEVIRDTSNRIVATFLQVSIYDAFQNFLGDYLEACNVNRRIISEPIKWEAPPFGSKELSFTEFVVPGFLLMLGFSLGGLLTAFLIQEERHGGTFERYLIAGIKESEILFAHFVVTFLLSITQMLLSMIVTFFVFGMPMVGSATLATVMVVLSGICGMWFGFAVSCWCSNDQTVNLLVMGCLISTVTFSGIIWPIEGMHYILQFLALFFPLTLPIESLRSIMLRGWDLSMEKVYMGFILLSAWPIIFMVVSFVGIRYKKT